MRRSALALAFAAIAFLGSSVAMDAAGSANDYIVRYRADAVAGGQATVRVEAGGARFHVQRVDHRKVERQVKRARAMGVKPRHVFRNGVGGFAARLTAAQVRKLRDDPNVASVEFDAPVYVADDHRVEAGVRTRAEFASQQLPTGIRRIYATQQPLAHIGAKQDIGVDIAVIDTGIATHPDLNIGGGVNCTNEPGGYTDRYGHGTHVAGIIGARDNGIGVVGVVPGARLWAVKVMDDHGSGRTSDIICGLDWMIGRQLASGGPRFIAANMSIAGPLEQPNTACGAGTQDAYHQLMCQAMGAGIVFAVAAANDSRVVNQRPAIYDEPITVGALADFDGRPGGKGKQRSICPWYSPDTDDTWANFSDWGRAVDIIAPGKCILSTYPGGRYAWMSGTSMATPHVAGAIALYRMRYPNALPQQVKQALVSAGTRDWKTSTAPDKRPYRLLQVRRFSPPPTFSISSVVAPSVPLGGDGTARGVKVTIKRIDGHYRPVRVNVSAPQAVDSQTLRIGDHGTSGTLRLLGTNALTTGTVEVTVRASDGELSATRTVRVPVDADPPVVSVSAPTGDQTIIQSVGSRSIAASASDGQSGVVQRTLQRRRAFQSGPMSCEGATWSNDGAAKTLKGSGPWESTGLHSGYCYQWVVTAIDKAGNATHARTATVWTDVSRPEVPTLTTAGDAAARGTTVWFRQGTSGRFTLQATARDRHSGITRVSISDVSGTGWRATSDSSLIDQQPVTGTAERQFEFTAHAGGSSVTIASTNGVDLGRRTRISLEPDGAAPTLRVTAPTRLTWLGSPNATVRYQASDAGAGISTVVARREQTPLRSRSAGCETSWTADGSAAPVTGGRFTDSGLARDTCYRWVITATDRVGNHRTTITPPVAIDPTRPVVDQVRVAIARRTVGTGGSVPVTVSWRLRTRPVGSTAFDVQRTTDGGSSWVAIDHPGHTSTAQATSLSDGRATTMSIRARSTTGTSSAWAQGARVTATIVEENGRGVSASNGWSRSKVMSASGGARVAASRKGAKLTYRFTGDSVAIVAPRERGLGTAIVRLDGKTVTTLHLGSRSTHARQVVWTRHVTPGRHTLTVTVHHGRVVVDGFITTSSTRGDAR